MSRKRLVLALVVAAVSDAISFVLGLVPVLLPIQWGVDIATAGMLFVILGWRWVMLPGLITEAIPGLEMLPLWVLVVAVIGAQDEYAARQKSEGAVKVRDVTNPAPVPPDPLQIEGR